jgi:PIN domain nuclease of toxin-antitoxin system
MNYLLDTHYLLWTLLEPEKVSRNIQTIIENSDNEIYVSAVSLWEISIKLNSGKLRLGNLPLTSLLTVCEEAGLRTVSLTAAETSSFSSLQAEYHKDPFDRMLVWQAIYNGFTFITDDAQIHKYTSEGLKVIS